MTPQIPNYEIKGLLGEGGMAVVYLAEQTTLHREVAIKVLRRELMYNENIRRRFLDEGRKLASLNHEHIIKVYDLISIPETVAMVMERVEGLTLKELLESYGKMEKKEALELLGQMTSALGYVHEQSYIHRDIKPSNFMVTNKGKVKLLDFGIAKDTGEEAMIRTQTGTGAMGTPMYMSPEQIKEVSKVQRQTDIYSLGVVLWQMLSGVKPYQGMTLSDFDLKYKIVHEPLCRLGNELDDVIGKATEKQVESRYRTCDEMWEAAKGNKEGQEVKWKESVSKDSFEKMRILFKVSLLIKGSLKYGFIDIKGNTVIQPIFDSLCEFDGKGYCCAQLNGRFGFINRHGNYIIQPIFDYLDFSFDDKGYCCAQLNGRFGFINRQGNWVIQPVFDRLSSFDDKDYCSAEVNGKFGFINRQGNWVIQPVFDCLSSFDDKDYCSAEVNGKHGFIERQGKWVIQPVFDRLGRFDDKGYCVASLNDKYGYINRQGNWIIQPVIDRLVSLGDFDDKDYCEAPLNDKYGFINRQGNWVIQPVFDSLGSFDDKDYCSAEVNGKYGFINRQGNWVIQPVFDSLGSFDDKDYCYAEVNGKYGFIERQGNWVIQPAFDHYLGSFDDKDYCVASLNDKYGFINRQGNWVIQPAFDRIGSFDDKDYCVASLNDKYGFINRQGNWIIQPIFDSIYNNYFSVLNRKINKFQVNNLKYGLITNDGKWVLEPNYWHIDFTEYPDIFEASLNNKLGFINSLGDWIIPPFYDYEIIDCEGEKMIWDVNNQVWKFDLDNRVEDDEYDDDLF